VAGRHLLTSVVRAVQDSPSTVAVSATASAAPTTSVSEWCATVATSTASAATITQTAIVARPRSAASWA